MMAMYCTPLASYVIGGVDSSGVTWATLPASAIGAPKSARRAAWDAGDVSLEGFRKASRVCQEGTENVARIPCAECYLFSELLAPGHVSRAGSASRRARTDAFAVGAAPRSVSSIAFQRSAVTYKSLHRFKVSDGLGPIAGLIDVNGTLYGTTQQGGASGDGTVFEVSTSGTERVLYNCKGAPDVQDPWAGLIEVNGTLYYTTIYGGTSNAGTVFEVRRSGRVRVLHSFKGRRDGGYPLAGLIDVNGILYGTTQQGGANNAGTVFEVRRSGRERVLYCYTASKAGQTAHRLLLV